ncbi:MAG: molybdopterin-dependent oxidoreductase [Actinobacteria bacterium]|nr:molybdopterin-dependent oxidoreductase [Actinomycetota bacterium]
MSVDAREVVEEGRIAADHGSDPKWFGRSVLRQEDHSLLTGQGRYIADISVPGQLHAAFVRSPVAHARILSIDTSAAESMEGVVAVFTAEDVPRVAIPPFLFDAPVPVIMERIKPEIKDCDQYILAGDKVRYVGEAVAMVIAESPYLAEDATELVFVDYDELPPVASIEGALAPGAAVVHEDWGDNIAARFTVSKGDASAAFDRADVIVHEEFSIQRQSALPLENRGVLATVEPGSSDLTVWSSTQNVHPLRKCIAKILGLPSKSVRVIAPDVGGGFGTKAVCYAEEPLVAFAALTLRRPVKWIEDRIEHMQAAVHAREQKHEIEMALSSDGEILGLRDRFFVDNGAFTHIEIVIPYNTICHLMGAYRIPNFEAHVTAVASTRSPTAPYRGAGRPEAVFPLERIIQRAALALDMDPVELRRKNLVTPAEMPYDVGILYRTGEQLIIDGGDVAGMLDSCAQAIGYKQGGENRVASEDGVRFRGFGFASYVEGTGLGPFEGAHVRIEDDGTVSVFTGVNSQGQGHNTVFAQICADALGVDPSIVKVRGGDTSTIRYGWGTIASRSAVVAGNAVAFAATELRQKILDTAATMLEADPVDLVLENGRVHSIGAPGRSFSLREVAIAAEPGPKHAGGPHDGLQVEHYFKPPGTTWASGVHAAEVEVDIETGVVSLLRYVVFHDCGRAINPMIVKGQVLGGVVQGIGAALLEEIIYDHDGQIQTVTLADYMIPTSADVPQISVTEVDSPSHLNPLGIKGIGEGGTVPPPAAIANAVEDALAGFPIIVGRTPLSPIYVRSLIDAARSTSEAG